MESIKNILKDKESYNYKPQLILENILQNLEKAIALIENPELKTKNKAELEKLLKIKENVSETLLGLLKERKLQTDSGKIYLGELMEKLTKLRRDSREILDFNKTWVEIYDLFDHFDLLSNKIKKIPYNHAGITIVGFGIIIFPFYNLISLALGGYLLYSSDYRGKIAGGLMILVLIGYFLVINFLFG